MDVNRQCRYVVLHHTGYGQPHYDFMIAIDDVGPLQTWRSPAWPIEDPSQLQPLPDHRRAYLTYEGDISGGRGQVRRVAAGSLWVHGISDESITLALDERRMTIARC